MACLGEALGQEGVWVELYSPRVVSLEAMEALGKGLSEHVRGVFGQRPQVHRWEFINFVRKYIECTHQAYI